MNTPFNSIASPAENYPHIIIGDDIEQIENLLLLCMVTAQFTVLYASLASQTRPTRGSLVHGEETRLERNSLHATGSLAEAVWKSGSARLTCETQSVQVVWETNIWRWVAVLT